MEFVIEYKTNHTINQNTAESVIKLVGFGKTA
jgi:hypothetical protein